MLGLHRVVPAFPNIADSLASVVAVTVAGAALAALAVMRFRCCCASPARWPWRSATRWTSAGACSSSRSRATAGSSSRSRARSTSSRSVRTASRPGPCTSPRRSSSSSASPWQQWMRGFDRLLHSVHPDDRARVAEVIEGPADGRQPEPVEYRCIKPNGDEVWVRDACAVVTTDGDDRRLLQGLLFDITAAKRAEADRDRLELDLRLGQKLESVGQLAAGIAHEINTPMQFVGDNVRFLDDAFSDVMRSWSPRAPARGRRGRPGARRAASPPPRGRGARRPRVPRERVPGAFERATDGVQRVATIVRAMKEFAHPRRRTKAARSTSTEALAGHARRRRATNTSTSPTSRPELGELPPVPARRRRPQPGVPQPDRQRGPRDRGRDRARQRGPRGTIRVRHRGRRRRTSCISITDTGPGIPGRRPGKIFDPFFTTKDVGRGTGQGLAIARRIVVERHGGTLTFETEQGRGTTFLVRLPVGQQVLIPRETQVAA